MLTCSLSQFIRHSVKHCSLLEKICALCFPDEISCPALGLTNFSIAASDMWPLSIRPLVSCSNLQMTRLLNESSPALNCPIYTIQYNRSTFTYWLPCLHFHVQLRRATWALCRPHIMRTWIIIISRTEKHHHHHRYRGEVVEGLVFGAFGAEGRWFEFHPSRHVGTMGKSSTRSCLYEVRWRPAWLPCGKIRLLY